MESKQSKNILFILTLAFLFFQVNMVGQVGINTVTPGDGALLDVESSDKGILVPRVSISDLATIAPVTVTTAGEESLLVYNTNVTTGKGFYYWDGDDWIALTPPEDGDFHEVGTSTVPSAITDDVFRTGKVAIGKATPDSALDVQDNTSANAASIASTGSDNVLNVTRSGSKSGTSRGIYINYANGDSGSNEQQAIGTFLRGGSGTGRRYGMFNNVRASVGNTRQLVGVWNNVGAQGAGTRYGTYNLLKGNENGSRTGTYNDVGDGGDGNHTGVDNDIDGTGTGDKIGTENNLGGNGNLYGSLNDVNGPTAGYSAYGTWNDVNSNTGTLYAGWFDAHGTGATYYAAVFNRGHVVANEASGDFDFRIEGQTDANLFFADASADRVGIGNNAPGYTLDVTGDIHFSNAIYNSGGLQHPDYVFESYFEGYSKFNETYALKSLEEVETFLKLNKHLPNIQSRDDVLENGWNVSEGVRVNLEKVEELFLYTIEASKQIKSLKAENELLNNKMDDAMDAVEKLTQRLNELELKSKS